MFAASVFVILPALLIASALCSGSETAMFSLTHADRARLRRSSAHAARSVETLLRDPRSLLVTILLLNNAVNVLYMAVAAVAASRFDSTAAIAAFNLAALLALILIGEVLAKVFAERFRVEMAGVVADALIVLRGVFTPVRAIFEGLIDPLIRVIAPGRPEPTAVTPEELALLVERGAGDGTINRDEEHVLDEIVALRTRRVWDIMTPRVDLTILRIGDKPHELLDAARECRQNSAVVTDGSDSEAPMGVVEVARLLAWLEPFNSGRGEYKDNADWLRLARKPIFVPGSANLDQFLRLLRGSGATSALVVDEAGALIGLASVEAVVEMLYFVEPGSILTASSGVQRVSGAEWVVPGSLSVRDWLEAVRSDDTLPQSVRGVSTVAGLFLALARKVPVVGDEVMFGTMRLRAEETDGPRLVRVRVALAPAEGEGNNA